MAADSSNQEVDGALDATVLDGLWKQAEAEIASGDTVPLDEFLRQQSQVLTDDHPHR